MIRLDFCKGKNIAVLGLGKAGLSAVKALSASGANVFVWDDGEKSRQDLEKENLAGVTIKKPEDCNWDVIDLLVMSPGIPLTHPEPHIAVKLAKCSIVCDIELLYCADAEAEYVGITGTNGKSTTTALTGHILKEAGVETAVGGNIGIPVLNLDRLGDEGVYVIETSSYQLDLIKQTRFNASILLNITPDHLDRHGGMEGYINAKKHIFENQCEDDIAIIGVDDDYSLGVYNELKKAGKIGEVVAISVEKRLEDGVSIIDGVLYDSRDETEIKIGQLKKLSGKHNAQNIAAAYVATKFLGIPSDVIIEGVRSFGGLAHRMQYLGEVNNVTYINDSKATNADAASKALGTFDNIYWIAGGVAKDGGIESLDEYFPKMRHAYLIGKAEDDFAKTLDGKVPYTKCGNLEKAFLKAAEDAAKNQQQKPVVLLSPACASFDQWPNFEVRGDAFCQMVKKIGNGKN